jgi:pullulanase
VGFILKDNAGGDKWNDITVVLNSSKEAQTVNIPEGEYTIVACDGEISEDGLGTMQGGEITINPQSALILHR